MVLNTIDRLRELTACRAVSGREEEIRSCLLTAARASADSVEVDRLGSVIARRKGTGGGRTVLLTAHMDEVGFLVLGAEDSGLLRYAPVGAIDPRVVVSKPVRIGEKAVPGVIGAKAIHLQSPEERGRVLSHAELRIDIGAADRASAEALVSPGDFVTFDTPFYAFGDGFVRSRALDDRVGCLTLLRLLEHEPFPVDIVCAFLTMEEAGCKGAGPVGWAVESDLAINFEGTSANDLGAVPETLQVCVPGKGVAISFMDKSSMGHKGLFDALRRTAARHGIPWQIKTGVAGGNDAGPVQTARGARPTCVLSVPCRSIHSGGSACRLSDIDAQYELAAAFLADGAVL